MSQLDQRCASQESHKPRRRLRPLLQSRGRPFLGNAPKAHLFAFYAAENATACYLPGTTGWGGQHSPNVPQGYGILSPRLEIQILASDQTISVSPSRARQTFPSWWKPWQLRLATLGLRSKLAPHQRFHPFQQPRLGQLPNPLLPHPLPVTCDSLPQYRWCGQRKTGQLCANLTARPSMRHRCGHQDCCD